MLYAINHKKYTILPFRPSFRPGLAPVQTYQSKVHQKLDQTSGPGPPKISQTWAGLDLGQCTEMYLLYVLVW